MAGNFSKVDEFSRVIAGYSDAQLEEVAPDYIWLAEVGPEVARANFVSRRDMIVEECERRGNAGDYRKGAGAGGRKPGRGTEPDCISAHKAFLGNWQVVGMECSQK